MVDVEQLKEFVQNNPKLVKKRDIGSGLWILKYTNHVFYKGLWNEFLEECRGTVVDEDFNVVTRPFTKIYNYGIDKESPVFDNDTIVDARRKVNGFLVNVSMYDLELLVTTSGSNSGPHVDAAYSYIRSIKAKLESLLERSPMMDHTLMFECVHPDDPHIIDEDHGLYLLGARKNEWNSSVIHDQYALGMIAYYLGVNHPESYDNVKLSTLKEWNYEADHEGFVFYTKDGQSAKMKSPYYLTTKFLARMGNTNKLLNDNIKNCIDEEYYPLIDWVKANFSMFEALDEQDRIAKINQFLRGDAECTL